MPGKLVLLLNFYDHVFAPCYPQDRNSTTTGIYAATCLTRQGKNHFGSVGRECPLGVRFLHGGQGTARSDLSDRHNSDMGILQSISRMFSVSHCVLFRHYFTDPENFSVKLASRDAAII